MNNRNQYTENWHDEIRPAILKRDGYKCSDCRIKHRSYVHIDQSDKCVVITRVEHEELKVEGARTYRVFLQVAHKDNVKSNNDPNNLLTLCPRCHHKRDKVHKSLMRISHLIKEIPNAGEIEMF